MSEFQTITDVHAVVHRVSPTREGFTICGEPIGIESHATQTSACWTCFRPTASEPSAYEADGILLQALFDLAYFGNKRPTICIKGTHVDWTCVQVDDREFNIDDEDDRLRLIEWGTLVRNGAPSPEPHIELCRDPAHGEPFACYRQAEGGFVCESTHQLERLIYAIPANGVETTFRWNKGKIEMLTSEGWCVLVDPQEQT